MILAPLPVADLEGARGPPMAQNFLNFMQFFAKSYVGAPGGLAPPPTCLLLASGGDTCFPTPQVQHLVVATETETHMVSKWAVCILLECCLV